MYTTAYFGTLMVALVFLIVLLNKKNKPNIAMIMTFTSILIAILGYTSISVSQSLEEALLANRIVYLGSVFLSYFMLCSVAAICGAKLQRAYKYIMILMNFGMLAITWTAGRNSMYYKKVWIEELKDGSTILCKEYGAYHGLYQIFLLVYLIGMIIFVTRAFGNRHRVSYKYSYLLIILVGINILVYALKNITGIQYEIMTFSYILAEAILLYIQHRLDLYDPERVLDVNVLYDKKCVVLLNRNMEYMGCSSETISVIPDIRALNLEYPIGVDAPESCRTLVRWVKAYKEDKTDNVHSFEVGDNIYRCEVMNYTRDNMSFYETHCRQNRCLGYIIVIKDDTQTQKYIKSLNEYNVELQMKEKELRNLNISLESAMEDALKANEAKSEFLSKMSHDIRTPMNGIVGMTRIAKDNLGNCGKIVDCLEKIELASNHLLALINDILDVSKMESGKFDITKEPFDLRKIFEDIEIVMHNSAVNAGVTLRFDDSNLRHPFVIGSALNVKRVLMNLVSNAIKYNRKNGMVEVSVSEKIVDKGAKEFVFSIKDTGIGMSEEFLQHIFEPFSRENEGAKAVADGTGLGMAIVKNLTELMGGSVWVSSKLGEGSCFEITLPLEIDENPVEAGELSRQDMDLTGVHILLVEDNELNLEIATYMLEDVGATITPAENGKIALEKFVENEPGTFDMILMDVMMPVMDGYAATEAIRHLEREDAQIIPIIAMTANAFAEDVEKAKRYGMNDHISKPLDVNRMFAVLKNFH